MNPNGNWAIILPGMFVLLLAGGCAKEDGRFEVWGDITLDGKPVSDGVIDFEPMENTGTKSGVLIQDGKYKITKEKGLAAGKYKVRITSGDAKEKVPEEGLPGPSKESLLSKERIPPDYNTNTKQTVEVGKTKENRFDFAIKTR